MQESIELNVTPMAFLTEAEPYWRFAANSRHLLCLDCNEGVAPKVGLLDDKESLDGETIRSYPDKTSLEGALARRFSVAPEQVVVTGGVDDALDRACRSVLGSGREIVIPYPTFEMIERYARQTGAGVIRVPWPSGAFPTHAVCAAISELTAAVAVVTPNNPTGAVAKASDLRALAKAAPQALIIVDLAYAEFADQDLMPTVLELPNAVALKTLSKAWGLAGLRVGYAIGDQRIINWLRTAGGPYPVSGPSLKLAARRLAEGATEVAENVNKVRDERQQLLSQLEALGAWPLPSQANFVCARFSEAGWVFDGLLALGIAVRAFPHQPELKTSLRITCPGNEEAFQRLVSGLQTVLAPQALIFDMDGVLADVSGSYRQAILKTAAFFGIHLRADEIAAAKAGGRANNDWQLTHRLITDNGADVELCEVISYFESLYQGWDGNEGLKACERLIPSRELLHRLASKIPLAVVTGRPRADTERFLSVHGIDDLFTVLVCMEDTSPKPDAAPVLLAMEQLFVQRVWMVGDTPDDMEAARAGGQLPIGIVAPEDNRPPLAAALLEAGAARVLKTLDQLEELLG